MDFAKSLIGWYQLNKRDLPWRNTKDPYKIWLSEVILQQTRVNQGMAYYYRFVESFPNVKALADASEQEVLKLWQGLGYYSRARNLHAASKTISQLGKFPGTHNEILLLKGIGPYTAAAIASFAFNEKVPVIDGNVYRVLSRYFGVETPIDSSPGKKQFLEIASEMISPDDPATYNQSIMELGALVCKPKSPLCSDCPLAVSCIARQKDDIDKYPVKGKKTTVKNRFLNYLVINTPNGIITKERAEKDIWKGLHDFPTIETLSETETSYILKDEMLTSLGSPVFVSKSKPYLHQLTHQLLHVIFWEFSMKSTPKLHNFSLTGLHELGQLPVPRVIEKYLTEKELV